jgi:MFS family permease
VQEAGAVLGPLAGAAVLSFSDWRAIFWLNLALAVVVGAGVLVTGRMRRPDLVGLVLGVVAFAALALQLAAPGSLVEDVTLGLLWVPLAPGLAVSTPLALIAVVAALTLAVRSVVHPDGAVLPLRGAVRLAREVDVLGSLLVIVALGSLVWAFAAADTSTQIVADGWVLLPVAAVAAVAFVVRERRAAEPVLPLGELRPPGAWGAMLVNLLVGVALVAALVDIPLFARETTTPGDQLGAALVLLRMLIAVPIGAVAGGWLARLIPPRLVAGGGMALTALALWAMTGWGARTLDGAWSYVVLVAAGLGFGLAIAPVNTVLLAVTGPRVHGSATALAVVARTVGMLVGLSLLTAVALHRFEARIAAIGSPVDICPRTPTHCPAYDRATDAAVLAQLHTVFAGAAIAAALAAVGALLLLRAAGPGRPAAG